MNIKSEILKDVIDGMLSDLQMKANGVMKPTLSQKEALRELGVILELVCSLHEKIGNNTLKSEIWVMRNKVVMTKHLITVNYH
ncbi:hypothetical protein [Psychrobacillus sp. FSL H8-0510]|uniref:hypothetical protein n=1 Tax=Psychrobacillus sp. FSL H8-0510 TaxID=2921394 RepID=UPI0030FB3188